MTQQHLENDNDNTQWQLVEEVIATLENSSNSNISIVGDNNLVISNPSFCNLDDDRNNSIGFPSYNTNNSKGLQQCSSTASLLCHLLRYKQRKEEEQAGQGEEEQAAVNVVA